MILCKKQQLHKDNWIVTFGSQDYNFERIESCMNLERDLGLLDGHLSNSLQISEYFNASSGPWLNGSVIACLLQVNIASVSHWPAQ